MSALDPNRHIPGGQIVTSSMYSSKCKTCKTPLTIARLDCPGNVWKAFDVQPLERNGLRFYQKHRCG